MIEPVWRVPAALLAANVLLGLSLTGAAGWRLPDGREPQRLSQQLQATNIEWLFAAPAKPVASSAPMPTSAPTSTLAPKTTQRAAAAPSSTPSAASQATAQPTAARPVAAAAQTAASGIPATPAAATANSSAATPHSPISAATSPIAPATAALRCLEWGSFNADEVAPAEAALREALNALPSSAHKPALSRRSSVEPSSWVVYLPSQDGLQTASTNATTLREMGITDFYVLQEEGPLRFALSLGVFRNAESAERHAAALEARGVRGAQIHARVPANTRHWLRVGNLEETQTGVLRAKLGAQAPSTFKARPWRRCG